MTYIVAEIGVNHDGDLMRAQTLIAHAKAAGADCVKFQLFEHLHEPAIAHLALPASDIERTRKMAYDMNIDWLCTPFTIEDAEALYEMGERRVKIASRGKRSAEWHLSLLAFVRSLDFEVWLSTGGMDEAAVEWASGIATPAVLLQCTSAYPAPDADVNLAAMQRFRDLGLARRVGYSDHTRGIKSAEGAAWMGADVIEKHLTDDRKRSGPDHAASSDPMEFLAMVRHIRAIEVMRGDGIKRVMPSEEAS